MKLLFVVQRYGPGFVGGAEKYTRELATGLAAEGHEIAVLTSCATSYADWADDFAPGTEEDQGVTVHRHRVSAARDNDRFIPLHLRAIDHDRVPLWPWAQRRWAQTMGPDLRGAGPHLAELAAHADLTVFVGYHYSHSLELTRIAAAHGPTMLVPTAHPEGAFHVRRVGAMFDWVDGVLCLAPEEAELVRTTYGPRPISVVPCPVLPMSPVDRRTADEVLVRHGLTRDRYGIVIGRIDPAKGSDDVIRFTRAHRRRLDPDFQLVVVGPGTTDAGSDGVVTTGFVSEDDKNALLSGAGVLIQPSYMESFSYSLMEGWQLERPALIQARSKVLAGHAHRGGGGLTYHDHAEFEVALTALTTRSGLRDELGRAGARYVAETFDWRRVADAFLDAAAETGGRGQHRLRARLVR